MPEENRYQHYEVLKRADGSLWELGHGAMGITYKAYDTSLRCPVALKVINATYLENETARQRFLREARAAAALRQQNVASVFHLGTAHGTYFYAMEFVDGQTVDECMKQKGRFTPLEALNVAFQVSRALAAAARQQLVHRDLKPANLMLVDEDGEQVVKVIDFGLAKSVKREGEDSGSLTVGGGFVGTPHFASPEQLEDRDLDVRSDIYSLGSTLYYLVTGRPPFSGSVAQIMSQHLYKPVPVEPLQGLPPPFINLILWMMEKDREKRPQSATELRRAIQHCVRELGVTELSESASGVIRALQADAMATTASRSASEATVEAGSVFARKYRVDDPLPDHIAGKRYRGVDLERRLTVSLLVLSREFLADALHFSALERAVDQVRSAPHPGLRQLIALETAGNQTVLVEEFLSAPSLQDILRVRGRLSAAEVLTALERLAPVADHARLTGLEHVDFTLSGIQLSDPGQSRDGADLERWIQQPLTEWPDPTPQVAPIDFAFQANDLPRWAGEATVVQPSGPLAGSKGSYVRQLSLLAYELLGGPRGALETQGRYIPLAALPEGGNQVLRRGLADEAGTAGEFVRTLAGCLPARVPAGVGRPVPVPATDRPATAAGQKPTPLQSSGGPADAPATNLPTLNDPGLPLRQASLDVGALLAQRYRLVDRLGDTPQGRHFIADDLRQQRRVSLLVISRELASDADAWSALQEVVNCVWAAPHPMLRAVYGLETVAGYRILVQEYLAGASLLEVLRVRNALSAPEVVRLLSRLAPLADHARGHRLQHVDLTLGGICLPRQQLAGSGTQADLLQRPLTAWEPLGLKVDAIDFSFVLSPAGTGSGPATWVHGTVEDGSRGSYVRLLSLLAYELLGGPRARLEATGQYTPLAMLTEGANAALRRGVIDEWPSAGELARQLAAEVGVTGPAASGPESMRRITPGPPPQIGPVETPAERPGKPRKFGAWRWALVAGLMACAGMGGYILYRSQVPPPPPAAFGDLAVESDPPGAAITLDEGPSLNAPHRFVHVPFGRHRLTANLKGYLPARQEVQLDGATPRNIVLTLWPVPVELATLSIKTEPAGASLLLDGKAPRQPPDTFTRVPFGRHRLTATLDGYEPVSQELEVHEGMSPEFHLTLQPIPTELPALTVRTEPAGASLFLDGKPPPQLPGTFTHVPFGRHQLTATLQGCRPARKELQLDRASPPQMVLTLEPVPTELAALSVQTEPAGASLFLDGKPPPQPPNTFTHVPFGPHRLTATLDRYEPLTQELEVREGMSPELRLTLRPVPTELAALSVQSEPAGASVLLDGKPPQQAPGTFTHVPFGHHRLTAALDRYESLTQDVDVHEGMNPELRLTLRPVPTELATLSIKTEPAGASLLLDGKAPRQPPDTFTHVPFGRHRLTATLDGYEPLTQELEAREGMSPELHLRLRPVPTELAALSVQTEPAGAAVLLDGKPPQPAPGTFTHVPFGRHRLTATLDRYESLTQDVDVHEGMNPELRLTLRPVPTELAALSVQSEPAGASVLLDGKPPQQPPNTFTHVPFGRHQLTATLQGYRPARKELQLDRASPPQMVLTLQPVPTELAALSVQTEPAGASILLDGKPPQQPPNTFTHVPFGPHRLAATLDRYEPLTQDMDVHEGMNPELRLTLRPVPTELAALSVQSEPAGASVLLDGKPPQQPPNTFTHVPFGHHQLTATLRGYVPAQQELQCNEATSSRIVLTLSQDPIETLRDKVKRYEKGSPEYLNAHVRLVQALVQPGKPNPQEYTELGQIIEGLRTKTPPISRDEFGLSYQESVRDAANLNVLPAILWLADNEKGPEAFDLFLRAATLGDSYAMMKVGRFYFRNGTLEDDKAGFEWLNRAYTAPKPNLEAGAYIGDCYLSGRGTKRDVQKAEKIVLPLANQGVVPAMVLAGRLFQYKAEDKQAEAGRSAGTLKQKLMAQADALYGQARPWWERAVERGDWNAAAHLGQLYEKGFGGVEKSEAKAEELYKEGITHGNVLAMYFYGLLISEKPDRRNEAVGWIKQAAMAGIPSAKEWLRTHEANLSEATSQDGHH